MHTACFRGLQLARAACLTACGEQQVSVAWRSCCADTHVCVSIRLLLPCAELQYSRRTV